MAQTRGTAYVDRHFRSFHTTVSLLYHSYNGLGAYPRGASLAHVVLARRACSRFHYDPFPRMSTIVRRGEKNGEG